VDPEIRLALIDDDEAVLDSLRLYLTRKGLKVGCFATAEEFLSDRTRADFSCVVADVRMPGMGGIELVRRLAREGGKPPVVLITGHGHIDMAVSAIKLGAIDFIEKPFDEARLLDAIRGAVHARLEREDATTRLAELRLRHAALSTRQRQVMDLAVLGLLNKEIAQQLAISPRTVEIHRAWVMQRMGARNLAELVRMDMELKEDR